MQVSRATFDGASANCHFMKPHDTANQNIYKVKKIYATDGRPRLLFSEQPHLIKLSAIERHQNVVCSSYVFIMHKVPQS